MPTPADIYSDYYIMTSYGGWSPCIQGNNAYGLRPFAGSVLPNCVGYTVGRFNEMLNEGACTWLASVNANQMLAEAISEGLSSGDDPQVGGVICWDSPTYGHCAVIEEVIDSYTVRTSESGWNYTSPPIVTDNIRTRTGNSWDPPWSGYVYQGIFYPPHPIVPVTDDYYMLWLQGEGGLDPWI